MSDFLLRRDIHRAIDVQNVLLEGWWSGRPYRQPVTRPDRERDWLINKRDGTEKKKVKSMFPPSQPVGWRCRDGPRKPHFLARSTGRETRSLDQTRTAGDQVLRRRKGANGGVFVHSTRYEVVSPSTRVFGPMW